MAGDDLFSVGTGLKSIDGGAGIDTVQIGESGMPSSPGLVFSLALQGQAQTSAGVTLNISAIENFEGWTGDDQLTGDVGANILAGNAGNDTLIGGAGDDILAGDGGFKSVRSDSGAIQFYQTLAGLAETTFFRAALAMTR